jgi:simple sugar transport system ATP-binding protein
MPARPANTIANPTRPTAANAAAAARGPRVRLTTRPLDEVFRLADRICLLRRGTQIGVRSTLQGRTDEIVAMITALALTSVRSYRKFICCQ